MGRSYNSFNKQIGNLNARAAATCGSDPGQWPVCPVSNVAPVSPPTLSNFSWISFSCPASPPVADPLPRHPLLHPPGLEAGEAAQRVPHHPVPQRPLHQHQHRQQARGLLLRQRVCLCWSVTTVTTRQECCCYYVHIFPTVTLHISIISAGGTSAGSCASGFGVCCIFTGNNKNIFSCVTKIFNPPLCQVTAAAPRPTTTLTSGASPVTARPALSPCARDD